MMKQKLTRKIGVTDHKKGRLTPVKYCHDCEQSTIHQTGSLLWISCRLQSGWRDINSTCNLLSKEGP